MALYELRESLDSISEMKDDLIAINADHVRKVAKEAYCQLGYYRKAKETVHRQKRTAQMLKTRIKALEEQLETARHQLEQVKQERDAWKRRAEAAERDLYSTHTCESCKHNDGEADVCTICTTYYNGVGWRKTDYAWRGPCAENGGKSDA